MFRWKFVGLRATENAIAEGRIDEAFDRLRRESDRRDPRAAPLVEELARLLHARARIAAQSGNYEAALADAERVRQLGKTDPDLDALRVRAELTLGERGAREALERAALKSAIEKVEAGRLDSGRIAVEQVSDPARREQLREQLDARVQRSEELLDQALAHMKTGDLPGAVNAWAEASRRHGQTRRGDLVAADLARGLESFFYDALRAGRLDRVRDTLEFAAPLRPHWPASREVERLVGVVRGAARALSAGDYHRLREALLRLRAASGEAAWVDAALRDVGAWSEAHGALLASPLGLLGATIYGGAEMLTGAGVGAARPTSPSAGTAHGVATDARAPLLVLVDGAGSFLLLRQNLVRIGRSHATGVVDVPLPGDVQSHHADIVREHDDYFVVAHGPVRLNQHAALRALLRDGDRLTIGGTARLTFRRPTARSESAVLLLSNHCRLPQDVSAVILMRDTCTIGPQANNHVRTREGGARLVLFERDGTLVARAVGPDGQPLGVASPIELGATREYGDQRVTIKPYEASAGSGVA